MENPIKFHDLGGFPIIFGNTQVLFEVSKKPRFHQFPSWVSRFLVGPRDSRHFGMDVGIWFGRIFLVAKMVVIVTNYKLSYNYK